MNSFRTRNVILLEKLIVAHLISNFLSLQPEVSLPCPQQPAAGPFPVPDESSYITFYFLEVHFNIILPCTLRYSEWSLQVFKLKFCVHFSPLPSMPYLPLISFLWYKLWCKLVSLIYNLETPNNRWVLGPTRPPTHWVPGLLPVG
jgi:hypothetical protein